MLHPGLPHPRRLKGCSGVQLTDKLMSGLAPVAEKLDRRFGWARLPYPLGLATLIGLRARLRERNLFDTGVPPATPEELAEAPLHRGARRPDGRFNDLAQPNMGAVDVTFGRNAPALADAPERSPSAREVSDALM